MKGFITYFPAWFYPKLAVDIVASRFGKGRLFIKKYLENFVTNNKNILENLMVKNQFWVWLDMKYE